MAEHMNIEDGAQIEKIDGRSKAARAARAAQAQSGVAAPARQAPRTTPRTQARDAVRANGRGKVEVRGRDGEVLTRKRTTQGDQFYIPPELIEPGWDMQWIAVSVVGNTEIVMDQNLQMLENGWRPVAADRFPGRYMPAGHKGQIIRGGQGLFERPLSLSLEARAEEIKTARQLITDRDQSLMGGKANLRGTIPDGFSMGGKYRGTGGDVRMSIDPGLDIARPSIPLADPGE